MKIAVATDHAAYLFKQELIKFLEQNNYTVVDCGCYSQESCDYPDFALVALDKLNSGEVDRAILSCSNGIGMSMIANRQNAMASLVYSQTSASNTRRHHNSNVLCLGAREFDIPTLLGFTKTWLATNFEGGRHLRRINKFKEYQKTT